jgi:ABC-type glutathione transport system ATPase component
MKEGRVIEQGDVEAVLVKPQERYAKDLLAAVPQPNRRSVSAPGRVETMPVSSHPSSTAVRPVLRFEEIQVRYKRPDGSVVEAVRGVSANLNRGEILGLVGESGSGKSTLAKTAVGLARPAAGRVFLNDELLDWSKPQMRWRRNVQYIFQDPRGALDPVARIESQVRLPLEVHRLGSVSERIAGAHRALAEAQLDESLYRRKPGSLSGGQRQRATIARALTLRPQVLICDESVSALDVSIQSRILRLLSELREQLGVAILFISHDLSVIHHLCDRVLVMRQGDLVEEGETAEMFQRPRTAYTKELIAALPLLPNQLDKTGQDRRAVI